MENIITVKNLTKTFKVRQNQNFFTGLFKPQRKKVKAVENVSFNVKKGESLAFLGPNGAGKTTTTKVLTGLLYPTAGSTTVLGYTPFEREKTFLKNIGLVMGNKSGLSWDLTARQSFSFLQKIYEIPEVTYQKNLNKLTNLLDIADHLDKQVRSLSLGERMKVELIGAILHNPDILFLDEPTIGLDITSKKNIRQFLREVQRDSNITLLLTSHDMDDVERVCDRVLVINKGRKVYDGELPKLMDEYNQRRFIKVYFEHAPDSFDVFYYAEVDVVDKDVVTFEVSKENVSKLISEIVNNYNILDIDIISVPLEDIIEDIFTKTSKVTSLGTD